MSAGRPVVYQDDHYQHVADVFYEAIDEGIQPRRLVAERCVQDKWPIAKSSGRRGQPYAAAGDWIREARRRGFITMTSEEEQYGWTAIYRVSKTLGVSAHDLAVAIAAESNGVLTIKRIPQMDEQWSQQDVTNDGQGGEPVPGSVT